MYKLRLLLIFSLACFKFEGFAQAKKTIVISGTSPDSSVTWISIANARKFFNAPTSEYLATSNSLSGKFNLQFKLDKEGYIHLFQLYKSWQLYAEHGDTLNFVLSPKNSPKRIVFSGKNAARYNVFTELQSHSEPMFGKFENLIAYSLAVEKWKERCDSIIKNYTKHKLLDKKGLDLIQRDVSYQYFNLIYRPLITEKYSTNIPSRYLKKADKVKLNENGVFSSQQYLNALLLKYIQYYDQDPNSAFKQKFKTIKRQLKGKSREFAITSLIYEYSYKQNWNDSVTMSKVLAYAKKNIKDSLYLSFIKISHNKFFLQRSNLPDVLMDNTFLTEYNSDKKISFRQLLDQHKDKGVYIDFWASWCEPCIQEIQNSAPGLNFLNGKSYVNIYISTDKDKYKWRSASLEHNITENQYLIGPEWNSPFFKLLELQSIPRYLIFDEQHKIKSIYAPRPSIKFLEELKKVVNDANQ